MVWNDVLAKNSFFFLIILKDLNEKKYHFHRSYSCYKTCSEKLTPKKNMLRIRHGNDFAHVSLYLPVTIYFHAYALLLYIQYLRNWSTACNLRIRRVRHAAPCSNTYLYLISFKIQCFDYYFQQQLVYFIKSIILKLLALFNFRFRYYIAI